MTGALTQKPPADSKPSPLTQNPPWMTRVRGESLSWGGVVLGTTPAAPRARGVGGRMTYFLDIGIPISKK